MEVLTAVQLVPEESKQRKKTSEEGNREPIVRIATYMKLTRNSTRHKLMDVLLRLRKSSLNCNSTYMDGIYPRAVEIKCWGPFCHRQTNLEPTQKKRKLKKKKYCWLRRSSGTTCGNAGHEPGSAGPTAAATRYMSPLLSCSVEGDVVSHGLNQPTLGTCYYPGIVKKIVRVRYWGVVRRWTEQTDKTQSRHLNSE